MAPRLTAELGSRALFPDLTVRAYLNHAAIAPACLVASDAVRAALDDYARFGVLAFGRWEERRQVLRGDIAQLLGAQTNEIALGWNTSRGLSDLALAIPWQPGNRVLLFEGEFPANVTPWQRAAEVFGLELVFQRATDFETGAGLQRLEDELRRGLRLVALSAVQFQTGLCMPLQQISSLCHAYGAEVCVDAIQACGAVPLNAAESSFDYLASGGHKWLLGFEGAGLLFIREACARRLRPITAGWLSHEDPVDFLFKGAGLLNYERPLRGTADVFETGTSSLLGLAALGATVPLLNRLGVERVFEHVGRYFDVLEPALVERGFASVRSPEVHLRSCILSVRPPPGIPLAELASGLRNLGVVVGTPDGYLRIAPHFSNNVEEVPYVLRALDDVLAKLRG
jgi:cysteine desulfurase / selenocysteine lyase